MGGNDKESEQFLTNLLAAQANLSYGDESVGNCEQKKIVLLIAFRDKNIEAATAGVVAAAFVLNKEICECDLAKELRHLLFSVVLNIALWFILSELGMRLSDEESLELPDIFDILRYLESDPVMHDALQEFITAKKQATILLLFL
uniref:MI domain-containing protein n=1 Tax=Elaeophora elaphi TaxID=1147741 RepID=A0A0R3S5U9_9BILA